MPKSISPLRYPGGKSRIYSVVKQLVQESGCRYFAEPFAGGAGLGLLLLANGDVDRIYINDLNKDIYHFWVLFKNDPFHIVKEIERISTFKTTEEWMDERERQKEALRLKADYRSWGFAVFFLNRVNFSGVLGGGPTGGFKQDKPWKINYHFNCKKLIEKFKMLADLRDRIYVTNLDYAEFLNSLDEKQNTFIFLDPPYVEKGRALYRHNFEGMDIGLEKHLRSFNGHWCLTYDSHDSIRSLYNDAGAYEIKDFQLGHFAGKYKVGNELLITPKKINK